MDSRNKYVMRAFHLEKVIWDNYDDVTKLKVNKNQKTFVGGLLIISLRFFINSLLLIKSVELTDR